MGKYQVDQQVSPEIAQDSEATLTAMKELERGWPRAMEKIAERASLTKGPDKSSQGRVLVNLPCCAGAEMSAFGGKADMTRTGRHVCK